MEHWNYCDYEETTQQYLGSILGHSKLLKVPEVSTNEDVAALGQGNEQQSSLLGWKCKSLVRESKTRHEELTLNFNELEMIIKVSSWEKATGF